MAPLLTRADVCKLLAISSSTLDRWIQQGRLPGPDSRFGPRSPRWKPDTIEAVLGSSDRAFH